MKYAIDICRLTDNDKAFKNTQKVLSGLYKVLNLINEPVFQKS